MAEIMGTRNNSQPGSEEVQPQLLDSEGTTCTLPPLESIHSERLLEALQCDMCNQTLSDPVTLFCGHSVCISHIPTAALGVKGNSRDSNTSLETGTATNLSQSLSCPVSTCCNLSNENTITLPLNGVSLTVDGLFPIRYPANLGTNIRLGEIISLVKENENSHGQSHEPWPRDATQAILDLLTCGICLSTLEHPITTPCQHSFCLSCVQRSMDNSPLCPLCRYRYDNVAQFHSPFTDRCLQSIGEYL
ncbi:hypothetical protein FRC20_005827 [Serendipita sp. 405]|nr:hypothetical protein FRC20_005827 [Serendipita sp. 405]